MIYISQQNTNRHLKNSSETNKINKNKPEQGETNKQKKKSQRWGKGGGTHKKHIDAETQIFTHAETP